jgi:hypothetical protein
VHDGALRTRRSSLYLANLPSWTPTRPLLDRSADEYGPRNSRHGRAGTRPRCLHVRELGRDALRRFSPAKHPASKTVPRKSAASMWASMWMHLTSLPAFPTSSSFAFYPSFRSPTSSTMSPEYVIASTGCLRTLRSGARSTTPASSFPGPFGSRAFSLASRKHLASAHGR